MTDEMQMPSPEEAEQLSEAFDRVVAKTLHELAGRSTHERLELIMRERAEGLSSPVRAGATVYVAHAVENDPKVAKYDHPTDDDLRTVLAKAETYTGQWYHSRVVLSFHGTWSPLEQEVAELDEDSGVFVVFDYTANAPTSDDAVESDQLLRKDC